MKPTESHVGYTMYLTVKLSMKKTLIAALLAATSFSALASDYFVVVPVPNRTPTAGNILVTLNGYSMPSGVVGHAYAGFDFNSVLQVKGDPNFDAASVRWSVAGGALPAGLSLSAAGKLTGTPSAAGSAGFQVMASYKTKAGQQSYQLVVADVTVALAGASLPDGEQGVAYSYDFRPRLSVSDPAFNAADVSWSVVGELPAGLTLSSSGVLSGVPTASGTQLFAVKASYFGKAGQQSYRVIVADITVALGSATLPTGQYGSAYSYDLKPLVTVTNDGAYSPSEVAWSLAGGALPDGVKLESNGVLSGTMGPNGKNPVQVTATYKGKSATQSYSLTETQIVLQQSGYRAWSDNSYAPNCKAYLSPSAGYQYAGATGSGVYRVIPPGGALTDVYCDMTTDGGGWTLVMRGLGAANTGWLTSAALNTGRSAATDAPTGATFKLADSTINQLRNGGIYRLRSDGLINQTRFAAPFTYAHTAAVTQAGSPQSVTYATPSLTGGLTAAAPLSAGSYLGITDDGGQFNGYFSAGRAGGSWSLSGGPAANNGQNTSLWCMGEQAGCNLTMWVR
jgi:hypothetical protein